MAKKLTELNAKFIGAGGPGVFNADMTQAEERHGVGVIMDCPCGCDSQLFVGFENPLDGKGPFNSGAPRWKRVGDTIEALTLTPSVQRKGPCGWHGFITDGEARTC